MPGPSSIYHLWKTFDISSNIGGACGEIVVLKGKYRQKLMNPLGPSHRSASYISRLYDPVLDNVVAAQNFEYKMSNILDKSLYVSSDLLFCSSHSTAIGNRCLVTSLSFRALSARTGILRCRTTLVAKVRCRNIFSAKQWCAHPLFYGSLAKRLKHAAGANIFTANMYQAEDRVRRKYDVNVMGLRFLYITLIDPMLGAGVEAGWIMDSPLRQVRVRLHRHSGSSAR